ncbi:MAG: F-type H+-transporting ATPase subunit b [Cellvibrionaceae bacterium]
MELNWSTFVLEILNFLVLMWVLKRFFYTPVLKVIVKRQNQIKQQMAEAETREGEAQALEARYKNRLTNWEAEKLRARQALRDDFALERERLAKALNDDIEQQRGKARAQDAHQRQDLVNQAKQSAFDQAAYFATKLLSRLASPELEARIAGLVFEDLLALTEHQLKALGNSDQGDKAALVVSSAYPLSDELKNQFETNLNKILTQQQPVVFRQVPDLLAGIRIQMGAWRLEASLGEELRYFSQQSHLAKQTQLSQ